VVGDQVEIRGNRLHLKASDNAATLADGNDSLRPLRREWLRPGTSDRAENQLRRILLRELPPRTSSRQHDAKA